MLSASDVCFPWFSLKFFCLLLVTTSLLEKSTCLTHIKIEWDCTGISQVMPLLNAVAGLWPVSLPGRWWRSQTPFYTKQFPENFWGGCWQGSQDAPSFGFVVVCRTWLQVLRRRTRIAPNWMHPLMYFHWTSLPEPPVEKSDVGMEGTKSRWVFTFPSHRWVEKWLLELSSLITKSVHVLPAFYILGLKS